MTSAPPPPPWQARHLKLEEERNRTSLRPGECKTELVRRLAGLAQKRHCSPAVVGWLQAQTYIKIWKAGRKIITFSENADGRFREHPALRLCGLSNLDDGALLTLSIEVDGKKDRLLSYSIGILGTARGGGPPWYARVDLHEEGDEDLRGDCHGGFCNHPLLHCHTGMDPSTKERPEVRAPLPWLMPWEALEWLLATADPVLEPEPRPAPRVDLNDDKSVTYWAQRLSISRERLKNLVIEVGPLVHAVKRRLQE